MTKADRRRLAFLHAARLEAAYDVVAKVQQQWIDEMQDVMCMVHPNQRNGLRELIVEARIGITKAHAAMLELAREMDADCTKEIA